MEKVYIIAEAGVNHNGNIELAKQMILEAKKAGADAVKFQTFTAESLVTRDAEKAQYQKETAGSSESQYQMMKRLELSYGAHCTLKTLCDSMNIDFLSAPFSLDSIELLEKIGLQRYKIPSGEITNYPYLMRIGKTHKPIILSTGMCTMEEVGTAVRVLEKHGAGEITLLHCNTQYPTPVEDVNLRAMLTMKEQFGLSVGYSDHTLGIEIPIAAAAMGASVIEKHFTLDKEMEGPDHRASLEPDELIRMVRCIRNVEKAFGDGRKEPSASERENINIARKSIVAAKNIKCGEMFTEENLTTKRPGNGISPMEWNNILGQKAIRDFKADELIQI